MKVKLITLEINGENIELTVEETRKLYNELASLFGSNDSYTPMSPYIGPPKDWIATNTNVPENQIWVYNNEKFNPEIFTIDNFEGGHNED